MQFLSAGDSRIIQFVQRTPRAIGTLRLSGFVLIYQIGDVVLLKNTLTEQVCSLSIKEWQQVLASDSSCQHVHELIRYRFLVEAEFDEAAYYTLVRNVFRTMQKKKQGIEHYTILPTTACNARCFYCYEEGWTPVHMTEDTADAVVEFICRTKQKGTIRIDWFGGEPLLAPKMISYICEALRNRKIEYVSGIITNGTLLTSDMAKKAVEHWHLKYAQVSMDGAKNDYQARKRYILPERDTYEKAMQAVCMLADVGVSVSVRCNYDEENISGLREFLEDCKEYFGASKNVSVYLAQLFQSAEKQTAALLFHKTDKIRDYADSLGFLQSGNNPAHFKTNHCMVDSENAVVIDPKGGLHTCQHNCQREPFGTVFDKTTLELPKCQDWIVEDCRSCPFLPVCTPFRKSCCPIKNTGCRVQMELGTIRDMLYLYRNHMQPEKTKESEIELTDC